MLRIVLWQQVVELMGPKVAQPREKFTIETTTLQKW